MSRSGYSEGECDDQESMARWIAYRGAVTSALRGTRGQRFLRELLTALDAMPEKRLVAEALVSDAGVCAMGAVALVRNLDVSKLDPEDYTAVAKSFGIAESMAREIAWENDESATAHTRADEPAERRWQRMRRWVLSNIIVRSDELLPDDQGARR